MDVAKAHHINCDWYQCWYLLHDDVVQFLEVQVEVLSVKDGERYQFDRAYLSSYLYLHLVVWVWVIMVQVQQLK